MSYHISSLLVMASIVLAPPHSGSSASRSTPEKCVRVFLKSLNEYDMTQALACVSGASDTPHIQKLFASLKRQEFPVTRLLKIDVKAIGDKADAEVSVKRFEPSASAESETLHLQKQADGWQIVPPDIAALPQKYPGFVTSYALAFTNDDVLRPIVAAVTRREDAVICANNVRDLAVAVFKLAEANDFTLSLKASDFKRKMLPYTHNESLFHCLRGEKKNSSYAFNKNMEGVNLAGVSDPANTVMIYEGAAMRLDFCHEERAVVGFADGHSKLVNADEAKKLRWKP